MIEPITVQQLLDALPERERQVAFEVYKRLVEGATETAPCTRNSHCFRCRWLTDLDTCQYRGVSVNEIDSRQCEEYSSLT